MGFVRMQRGHDGKAIFLALGPGGETADIPDGSKVNAVWTKQRALKDGLYLFGQDFDPVTGVYSRSFASPNGFTL